MDETSANDASLPAAGTARAIAHFAERPAAELLYLAQHAARYPPAVGAAAVAELQRRGLVPEAPVAAPLAPPAPEETWAQLFQELLKSLFWPTRRNWVTPLLLNANLLVFLLMVAAGVSATAPRGHDLVAWGSNVSDLTLHGQPWRLLTSVFVHAGVAHLLLNGFSLWLLGVMIEIRSGGARLLAVYLASGVGGALASLWYHSQGVNSTGASGAIFGLYGFLLVLLIGKKLTLNKSDRQAMLGLVLYLVLSNLISGLEGGAIDNAAHVGGLLTGLLVAGPLALLGLPRR